MSSVNSCNPNENAELRYKGVSTRNEAEDYALVQHMLMATAATELTNEETQEKFERMARRITMGEEIVAAGDWTERRSSGKAGKFVIPKLLRIISIDNSESADSQTRFQLAADRLSLLKELGALPYENFDKFPFEFQQLRLPTNLANPTLCRFINQCIETASADSLLGGFIIDEDRDLEKLKLGDSDEDKGGKRDRDDKDDKDDDSKEGKDDEDGQVQTQPKKGRAARKMPV